MLIAECCQNHLGDPEILKTMVAEGAKNGATHLKIQGLYYDELNFRKQFEEQRSIEHQASIVRPFEAEVARLKPLTLSLETETEFVQECKAFGVIPMITVFTHSGLDRAVKAGFRSFKIASYDCSSMALISRILPVCDELVISTGATSWDEIARTANFVAANKLDTTRIVFLHAVTEYPTEITSVRLLRMTALKQFGFAVGYSDHTSPETTNLKAAALAIKLGATAIERHFTVLEVGATKDGPVSVNPSQLSLIARMFSSNEILEGNMPDAQLCKSMMAPLLSLDPSDLEIKNREYYRGRVVSTLNGVKINSWEDWPLEA
jgi:sialic acid synthase SpsE